MDKQRQYLRVGKSLQISYRVSKQLLGSASRSTDISPGGIRMPIHQQLQPGTILELQISSPEIEKPIIAIGEIVWLKPKRESGYPFETGIKFIKITPIHKEILARICQSSP